ncbi:MAG TPA: SdiA-regulated domain-containing protein [Cytophaga sp.]|jgi:uncharacterized protein YjiK|nr:SdiA-regulated domain-containing protein [Cytophaga sp.]
MIFNKRHIQFFYPIILFAACAADKSNALANIDGYDYAQMKEIKLEHALREISGIAYHAATNTFAAINDEKGTVYILDANTYRVTNKYMFEEEGDYEEIQFAENDIYVLRSDGAVYKMQFDGKSISNVETFEYTGAKAEYESFYVDTITNTLVLIPKQSKIGTKEKQTITYTINALNGTHAEQKEHTLKWRDLESNAMLHPSAVAIHPVSKNIYLLVSIEKKLLVLNASWKIIEEYELDHTYFKQPEGMTFDSKGNLYITNEGGEGSATIIQIPILSK